MRRILQISFLFLFLSAIMLSSCNNKVGGKFYSFKVKALSGDEIRLDDYRGKILLINVWDTICPPCVAEFPSFIELYNTYNKDGLEILGLTPALYANKDEVKQFLIKHGINYPNAIVSKKLLSKLPKGKGIPITYLINQDGILLHKYIGYQEKATFENHIKLLFEKKQL